MMKNRTALLTKSILAAVLLTFVSAAFVSARDTISIIKERKKLIVGLEAEYPPFEFKNDKGELVGFDVDVAKKIAERLGVEIEIKEYKWDQLLFALKWQEIDMVISGMTRTLERAMVVNFSDAYFETGQVVMLSPRKKAVSDWRELNNESVKIAVCKDTTGEITAKNKLPNASLIQYLGEAQASTELIANRVDAFVFDKPYADDLVVKYPQLRILPDQLSYELYCFAIDEGDLHYLLWLNYFLDEIRLTGEYEEIYNYWFVEKRWKK